jgi:hypothetical protein
LAKHSIYSDAGQARPGFGPLIRVLRSAVSAGSALEGQAGGSGRHAPAVRASASGAPLAALATTPHDDQFEDGSTGRCTPPGRSPPLSRPAVARGVGMRRICRDWRQHGSRPRPMPASAMPDLRSSGGRGRATASPLKPLSTCALWRRPGIAIVGDVAHDPSRPRGKRPRSRTATAKTSTAPGQTQTAALKNPSREPSRREQ